MGVVEFERAKGELPAVPAPRSGSLGAASQLDARAIVAWTVGFAPVLYLALRGGGYDLIVRSEVGLVVWWGLLLGVVARAFPLARIGRLGWICAGLLAALALWSGIAAATWSSSAERSFDEVSRLLTYLGFLALGLCVLHSGNIRQLVSGMASAFALIGALAVLSRFYPSLFPPNQVAAFFPGSGRRLNYPLNYADGTGNLLAIGLPLLLATATRARTIVGQAVAAAALPVLVLGILLTASRGAVVTAAVGLVVYFALAPDRLPRLATAILAAAGSAILVEGVLARAALRDALSTPVAIAERHRFAIVVLAVCVGVAVFQVGIVLAARRLPRPRVLQMSRRRAAYATVAVLLAVVAVASAAGVPGKLAGEWRSFKQATPATAASANVYDRLGNVWGSHRYQYWSAAVQAFEARPLTGIGPGTFAFYWAQHGAIYEFILNAHSLYLETLAETGLVGFLLIVSLLLVALGAGVRRALRAPPGARATLAAATAALAAFCAAAGYDWMWQLPVAPVAALLLAAAILVYREPGVVGRARGAGERVRAVGEQVRSPGERVRSPGERVRSRASTRARAWAPRVGFALLAVAAMLAIVIPYRMTSEIRASQAAIRTHNVDAALADAATAQRLEPYAATPRLQRALILEAAGDLTDARTAVAQAAAREPLNWQIWLIRARIDAEGGHARAAVRDYRRAHALDPRSPATAL